MYTRVSNNLQSAYFRSTLTNTENNLFNLQKQTTSGKLISFASENPDITRNVLKYQKTFAHMDQYLKNIRDIKGIFDYSDGVIRNINEVLQRIREIAVQAANGVYSAEDRQKMALEVDELLKQIYHLSNEKFNDKYLFAGFKTLREPFIANIDGEKIKDIYYAGDNGSMQIDVGPADIIEYNITGNKLFYSENTTIIPKGDFFNFVADSDFKIKINNTEIKIFKGDTIEDIISRINKANAGVVANIDLDTGEFYIKTTYPHKPFLEDIEGNLLEKMNIIDPLNKPPFNISNSAKKYGGSLFDQLIQFRDNLEKNDQEAISTRTLQFIDMSIDNLTKYLAINGAKYERIEMTEKFLEFQKIDLTEALSNIESTDITEAISRLKSFETVYQASLQIATMFDKLGLMYFLR